MPKPVRPGVLRLAAAVVLAASASAPAFAQSVIPYQEYEKKLRAAEVVEPLSSELFGDNVSLYNGATEFMVADIDLPGNNALPVRLGRRFKVEMWKGNVARLGGFGAWDIDVPYMVGTFSNTYKWNTGGNGATNRCSQVWYPRIPSTAGIELHDIWSGTHVYIPGQGERELLHLVTTNNPVPTIGGPYNWTTRDGLRLSCKASTKNGYPGEGFVAVDTNGTRYTFDVGIERQGGNVQKAGSNVARTKVFLMASRVEDRHGNYVDYEYVSGRLNRISSSDGRTITLEYENNRIKYARAHGRTWTYSYTTAWTFGGGQAPLTQVVQPDGSKWTYEYSHPVAYSPLDIQYPPWDGESNSDPGCPEGAPAPESNFTLTATHPSGALGTFQFSLRRMYRSGTPVSACVAYFIGSSLYYQLVISDYFDVFALQAKTLSGPGLAPQTWGYTYGGAGPGRTNLPTPCMSCAQSKLVEVIQPDGTKRVYQFGILFGHNDGRLLSTRTLAADNTLLRSDTNTYVSDAEAPSMPFRNLIGILSAGNDPAATRRRPVRQTTIEQQGATFESTINTFDSFARPVSVTRNSSLGFSRTDLIAYDDDLGRWVLGQIASITDQGSGGVSVQNTYYAGSRLLEKSYAFGLLQQSFSYRADGTLQSVADGLGRTTTLSSWKRGVPQLVVLPGAAQRQVQVNDSGWIEWVTDERGNTTQYGYDAMGRIASISYPAGDTVAWSNASIVYSRLTSSELGVAANSWRRQMTVGAFRKRTYFDARLQPVLDEERDTLSGKTIYRRFGYDHAGRVVFASYPSATSSASAGIRAEFDAAGRLTRRLTTDGVVVEQLAYLSGYRRQVTDADGRVTVVSYQAFDQPEDGRPIRIESPENQTTVLNRDVFGKLTSVTQSGTWSGGSASATRTFTYDSFQRLCRRVDPESGSTESGNGSTVWGYDAASQVTWEAKGQSGSGCLTSAPSGATLFTYHARGWKLKDDYPGTAEDVNYGYDAAGNLTSIANGTASWSYSYNKRNLIETEQAVIDGKTLLLDPTYNGLGHLASLATPGQTISYAPDAWGRPTQLGSWLTGVQYHPNGLPASYTLSNGLSYSLALNARQWPQTQDTKDGSVSIQKYVYGYSQAGDLTSINDPVDGSDSVTMTYDALHRLTSATGVWGSYGYVYDPLNNIRSRSGPGALTYTYNATSNRLTGISGAQSRTYSYNAKGEITGDGVRSFTLNSQGQIASITGIATYGYHGNGRRIKVTKSGSTEYTLYDRAGRLVYTELGTTKTDYLALNGQTVVELKKVGTTTTPTYLHPDLLGSPRKATAQNKAVLWAEHYDPYGLKLNGISQKIGYTGHAHDAESGYTYMQARFYDPLVGRFLSTDPIHFVDANPFTFNRYSYANNNPYRYTDPNGEFAFAIPVVAAWIGKLAAAGAAAILGYAAYKDLVEPHLNENAGDSTNSSSADVPGKLVGEQDRKSKTQGGRHHSGPLSSKHGGTGDVEKDFDRLTGGKSGPAPAEKRYPEGTIVGENGISLRPATEKSGPRIDIPAKGDKPAETLHYPKPPPPREPKL